jgi:hypothetical protein
VKTAGGAVSRSALLTLLLLGGVGSGCTVADNLSAGEILGELDAIVVVQEAAGEPEIRYRTRAEVSSWYARSFLVLPVRGALVWLFGGRSEQDLAQPRAHVRALAQELPDEVGSDLQLAALATSRLGWLAELETNAQSRIVAVDGLARIARALRLPLFDGDPERLYRPVDPEAFLAARAALADGDPGPGGAATALTDLVRAPLGSGVARLRLLEELTGWWLAARDPERRQLAAAAVRTAIQHFLEGLLLRIVEERQPELVDLRLCAMEHIRSFGGPRVVPLLLAVMSNTAAEFARGESRFDPDPLVQLRLIHYCGQLAGAEADAAVVLPTRRGVVPLSPRDFLANTVLNERAHYSKLRAPALEALSWSLGRPRYDPDPAWVREWRDQRR